MVRKVWKIKVNTDTDKWNNLKGLWSNNVHEYIFKIIQNSG